MDLERALDSFRLAFNAYMSWADTPGSILTLIVLPVGIILGLIGWVLDRRASYWRQS